MRDHLEGNEATHYRWLALHAYAAAKLVEDLQHRQLMERIALAYENLAACAETREYAAELIAGILRPKT